MPVANSSALMPTNSGSSVAVTAVGLLDWMTSSDGAPTAMAVRLLRARPMPDQKSGTRKCGAIQMNEDV